MRGQRILLAAGINRIPGLLSLFESIVKTPLSITHELRGVPVRLHEIRWKPFRPQHMWELLARPVSDSGVSCAYWDIVLSRRIRGPCHSKLAARSAVCSLWTGLALRSTGAGVQ